MKQDGTYDKPIKIIARYFNDKQLSVVALIAKSLLIHTNDIAIP
jgi:hypothetical protein